jgi:hypothetical protein
MAGMFETRFVWANPLPRAAFWSLVPAAAAGPAAPVITTPALQLDAQLRRAADRVASTWA